MKNKLTKIAKDTNLFLKRFIDQQKKTGLILPMNYGLFSGGKKIRSKIIIDIGSLFKINYKTLISIGAAVDDTQFAETTINILKNEDERKKVYDQIDSVNKILLDPNLSRKEKRKLKKFLDNPETESIDFNILHQIDSARKILLYPNLSRKEKRKLKKFIKQLENEIILENN
jgi:geranylgeranyl pyrophosphate synthase